MGGLEREDIRTLTVCLVFGCLGIPKAMEALGNHGLRKGHVSPVLFIVEELCT